MLTSGNPAAASALFVLSSLALAAIALQMTGLALLFGFDVRPIMDEGPELGSAYIVPIPQGWGAGMRDQRAYVTENGTPLGPANSQHANIRNIGRGAFSFYNGALRFSASDNTDPRENGRAYEEHIPAAPPMLLTLAVIAGLSWSAASLYRSIGRDRIASFCAGAGIDGTLLAFVAFAALTMTFKPWSFLIRAATDGDSWTRIVITALISLGFSFVRAADLNKGTRTLFRTFAILSGVICALRWYPELPGHGSGLDSWLLHGGRWLGAAAAVAAWVRPSFLLFAIGSEMWARGADERLTGFPQADVDEAPVAETAIFLLLWCCLVVLVRRLRGAERWAIPHQALTLGLYGALGIHLANYLYSSIAKLQLDGPVGSWVLHNPTHALLANGNQLGAAPLGAFPAVLDAIYQFMGHAIVGLNLGTWATQAASLPAMIFAPALPWLLIVFDLWHLAVAATTGIVFWKWIIVNAGFVAALRRVHEPVRPVVRFVALALCVTAPLAFDYFPAGWYDTFNLNRLQVFAVTDTGRVRVPPAFFLHYAYGATTSTFWAPDVMKALFPTATYGTTLSLAESMGSRKCSEVAGFRPGESVFLPGVAPLVQSLHRAALSSAGADGRPSELQYDLYPYHIATTPFAFNDFWSLNLHRVKAYILEIQATCTAAPSLVDRPEEGPSATMVVDVGQ